MVYRHSPLASHPFAVAAARASECAGRQDRFEAYHDALFVEQESIGLASWTRFATEAALPDIPAFERCLADAGPSDNLGRDTLDARRLRVDGTPTFLVNGLRFDGTPPLEMLRAYVRRAVAAAEPPGSEELAARQRTR